MGTLILFPSPIAELGSISTEERNFLLECYSDKNTMILIEDHKPARRRWVSWGLPREAIDELVEFNEHNMSSTLTKHIETLKSGKNIVLLSDGGLPGFCDPGAELIFNCHLNKISVSCMPFHTSVMLALVLSGLPHHQFSFLGFPPAKKLDRKEFFKKNQRDETLLLMDTPYRFNQIVEDLCEYYKDRLVFIGMNLGSKEEECILINTSELKKKFSKEKIKREFVIVVGPKDFVRY